MQFLFPPDLQRSLKTTDLHPPFEQNFLMPCTSAYGVEGPFGSLYHQETNEGHFRISYQAMFCDGPVTFEILSDGPAVMLLYVLQADVTLINARGQKRILEPFAYYGLYAPGRRYTIELGEGTHQLAQITLPDFALQQLGASCYEISFIVDCLSRRSPVDCLFFLSGTRNEVAETIVRLLSCELDEPERVLFQTGRLMDLLIQMSEDLAYRYKAFPRKMKFTAEDIHAVKEALDLQRTHDGDPLSLSQLSRKVNLHPKKLNAGFRLLKGKTSRMIARENMVARAKMLLKDTELSIAGIAYELGYCNSSAFVRAFTRGVGMSPGAYRK